MAGMCAIFMAFAGQFAFFTYIRPVYMTSPVLTSTA